MDRPWLVVAVFIAPLLFSPGPAGAVVPQGLDVAGIAADPGEPIIIRSPGPVRVTGDLSTQATSEPGAPGPDIVIQAEGPIHVTAGVRLVAGDGADGQSASSVRWAEGGPGGDGGSIILDTENLHATGALLRAGDGGHGGPAAATGTLDATARGGDGGTGGRVTIPDNVVGWIRSEPGDGGQGGDATAAGGAAEGQGRPCDGTNGADAEQREPNRTAGDGAPARTEGGDGRCGLPDAKGGRGGHAEAYGGAGGPSLGATGGDGGNATAIGGLGGQGMDACFDSAEEAMGSGFRQAGHGGPGGYARAIGGDGGPGAIGGRGGDAYGETRGGDGGNATPPILLGDGGPNFEATWVDRALVAGGRGGPGVDGGGGGEATGSHESGSGGSPCGHWEDLAAKGISASVAAPLLGLLVAAWSHRQRGVHEP